MSSNQPPEGPYTPQHGPYGQQPGQPPQGGNYGQAPQGPYGQPPQGPYGQPPQGPYGQAPQGPYGQPPQGPYGQAPQGPYGQPPQGPYGQAPQGPYGHAPQGPYGQPPQGPPGGGGQPPEYLTGGSSPRRGRRGLVVGGVALASVLILGGVTFGAYSVLNDGGSQPAEAVPSNALAFARIDLNPSAGQKVDLINLLNRFPDFEETTGISGDNADLREHLIEEMLADSACDLTYERDFEPWIGDRAAFAAVPVDDTAAPVISIQVKDEAAARDAVDALTECGLNDDAVVSDGEESSEDPGIGFVGEYMVMTEKDHLSAVVDGLAESSLADNEAFQQDMDALGEQGVMSYWVDFDALAKIPEFAAQIEEQGAGDMYDGYHSAYGTVRAGDDYIEVYNSARTDQELGDERTPVGELPESTMVAGSFSGGGELVNTYWGSVEDFLGTASGGYGDDSIAQLESQSGLSFPEDLATVFGESLTFVMSPDGLDPETLAGADPAQVDVGARFVTDKAALEGIVSDLEELAAEQGAALDLVTSETEDGLVVASNQEYADEVAAGGSLGDSDAFQTAVPDADDSVGVLYVDLDKVHEVVERFSADDEGAQQAARYLEPLQAAGFSVAQKDGHIDTVLRLTFD